MRAALGLSALVILLLAQPGLAVMHGGTVEQELPGPDAAFTTEYDPLLRSELLFLTADGGMAHEAPAAGAVAAPMALPGEDSVAVWAHDATMPASFAGDTAVTLPIRVRLPAAAVPPRALFTVSLLLAGEAVATSEAVSEVLFPGDRTIAASLPTEGVAFVAGDGIGLQVAMHTLSLDPAPTVEYLVGPEGAQVSFALRFASLDALGHRHAGGDRHFPLASHAFREGDLGGDLVGARLGVWGARASPASLEVPAGKRLLLQVYLDRALAPADAPGPAEQGLALPGGSTTLYEGEVLVREVTPSSTAEVACTTCGPSPQSLATLRAAPPPLQQQGEPLEPTRLANGSAAGDLYSEVGWVLALFAPAGVMLGAAMWYVLRRGGEWHTPSSAPSPAPAPRVAQRGQPQPRAQQQRLGPGAPARRL